MQKFWVSLWPRRQSRLQLRVVDWRRSKSSGQNSEDEEAAPVQEFCIAFRSWFQPRLQLRVVNWEAFARPRQRVVAQLWRLVDVDLFCQLRELFVAEKGPQHCAAAVGGAACGHIWRAEE